MSLRMSPSLKRVAPASTLNLRSRRGCAYSTRGSSRLPLGRENRPECVSCNPTYRPRSSPIAVRCAATRASRSPAIALCVCSAMVSWFGFARPSGRTATASPPQMSFAPLAPNRRQRRSVFSLGAPSRAPSQPSIGWIAKRLPIVIAPSSNGAASGPSAATTSSTGRPSPASRRCAAKFATDWSDLTLT
jgi:hypothetical protein